LKDTQTPFLLHIKGISKSFPGVQALDDVSMSIIPGEIHGLVGENGAGKSTLIKTIGGVQAPDKGSIFFDGEDFAPADTEEALKRGIAIVYQELSLCENMSVAENLFINRHPLNRGLIDKKRLHKMTEEALGKFNLTIRPNEEVSDLPLAVKEQIEILRALSYKPKLLILDEPTGPLSKIQANMLFDQLKELQKEGITILYISHFLGEVLQICDRITVFRDGKYVNTVDSSESTEEKLAGMMVGRDLGEMYPERPESIPEDPVLEVQNLSSGPLFQDVSFSLNRGEIFGIAGLVGAGRTETALTVFGSLEKTAGKIIVEGKEVEINSPKDAIKNGIAYLSEDRKLLGLFLEFSIAENLLSVNLKRFTKNGFLQKKHIQGEVQKYIGDLNIKASGTNQIISQLSGGNQQKTLFAKWVSVQPNILIIDEPTRGVDVGAKKAIHELLRNLTNKEISVIMISSDLPEVLGMSDRIMIMDLGKVVDIIPNSESITEEYIMNRIVKFRRKGMKIEQD
jgi:ABC-type sugar transport system ATPase subunit